MKYLWSCVFVSAFFVACSSDGTCPQFESSVDGICQIVVPAVRLNTVGYSPSSTKEATYQDSANNAAFAIVDSKGNTVFTATAGAATLDADTSQTVRIADFSAFATAGTYTVHVPGVGDSASFTIAPNALQSALTASMTSFYLQRCGTAIAFDDSDNGMDYAHAACHMGDAHEDLLTVQAITATATGGWHDAGDYGKYTANGAFSAGMLLLAGEHIASVMNSLSLPIPEHGGALPDYLAEVKWELDWLLTMQLTDGSASEKIAGKNWPPNVLPNRDTQARYFDPATGSATGDFVAVMSRASRDYAPYDATYASTLQAAAAAGYAFLQANPSVALYTDPLSGGSAGYPPSDPATPHERLWALAEMWATTGDATLLTQLESSLGAVSVQDVWDWADVTNFAIFTYLDSTSTARNPTLVATLTASLVKSATNLGTGSDQNGYGRAMNGNYYWGANGVEARTAITLELASRFDPTNAARYVQVATRQVDHLLGRNPYARSQVTGVGYFPPQHPHHGPSEATNAPWPGFLVGGGNCQSKPATCVPALSWVDEAGDYYVNEVAINWSAPMVYALAMVQSHTN
jgi:endoglucanase